MSKVAMKRRRDMMGLLSQAVREALGYKEITQNEFARRLGVSKGYVSELLNGTKTNVTFATIARMEAVLGCKIIDIRLTEMPRARLRSKKMSAEEFVEQYEDDVTEEYEGKRRHYEWMGGNGALAAVNAVAKTLKIDVHTSKVAALIFGGENPSDFDGQP